MWCGVSVALACHSPGPSPHDLSRGACEGTACDKPLGVEHSSPTAPMSCVSVMVTALFLTARTNEAPFRQEAPEPRFLSPSHRLVLPGACLSSEAAIFRSSLTYWGATGMEIPGGWDWGQAGGVGLWSWHAEGALQKSGALREGVCASSSSFSGDVTAGRGCYYRELLLQGERCTPLHAPGQGCRIPPL